MQEKLFYRPWGKCKALQAKCKYYGESWTLWEIEMLWEVRQPNSTGLRKQHVGGVHQIQNSSHAIYFLRVRKKFWFSLVSYWNVNISTERSFWIWYWCRCQCIEQTDFLESVSRYKITAIKCNSMKLCDKSYLNPMVKFKSSLHWKSQKYTNIE